MHEGWILRNLEKNISERVVTHRHRLPRNVTELLCMEVSKNRRDVALRNMD